MDLSERLKDILAERGWSQADLCRASGMHPSTINRILSGERTGLSYKSLKRLSSALDKTYSELTGEEDPKPDGVETDPQLIELQMNALAIKRIDPEEYELTLRQLAERRALLEKRHKEEMERRRRDKRSKPATDNQPGQGDI